MPSEFCGALLCIGGLIIVLSLLFLSVGRSVNSSPQSDEYLEVQRERNAILREQLQVQKMEAEMQYAALKQSEKEAASPAAPEQVESPQIPLLKRGETHRYTKEPRPRQVDNFPDDPAFQKRQAEQDERIERLKHWKGTE